MEFAITACKARLITPTELKSLFCRSTASEGLLRDICSCNPRRQSPIHLEPCGTEGIRARFSLRHARHQRVGQFYCGSLRNLDHRTSSARPPMAIAGSRWILRVVYNVLQLCI